MRLGEKYVGRFRHATNLHWLMHVVGHSSLEYVSESGASVYQERFPTHVMHLFADPVTDNIADDEAIHSSHD